MKTPPTKILDAACGGRMIWNDKTDPRITAQDIRTETVHMTDRGKTRTLEIRPDIIGDFRAMQFHDAAFNLILFDPPHLLRAGDTSWLRKKYGCLNPETWSLDLDAGFRECWRILANGGTLIFKWNSCQIPLSAIAPMYPDKPLFISRQGKTYFIVFSKP